jgi:methyl-galactoside transport system substrate-binding protein
MKNTIKKALVLTALVIMCNAMLFAGGGSEKSSPGNNVRIGIATFDFANANQSYLIAAYKYWASQYPDVVVNIIDGQNDQTIQNDRIDIMLNQGIDVLICNLVNGESGATIIDKCKKANIPVVFIENNPTVDVLKTYDRTLCVGMDGRNHGYLQGVFVEGLTKDKKWDKNGDGKIQYVYIMGLPGHVMTNYRRESFLNYCKEKKLPVEEFDAQPANWRAENARDLAQTWIGKYGNNIELVVSQNDGMAMGAVEALRGAGMIGGVNNTAVIGVNALPEAVRLIESGEMLMSVLTNPTEQAHAAMELARASVLVGGPYTGWAKGTSWTVLEQKNVVVPDTIITKDNLQVARDAYKK